jgi:hypothetical protein
MPLDPDTERFQARSRADARTFRPVTGSGEAQQERSAGHGHRHGLVSHGQVPARRRPRGVNGFQGIQGGPEKQGRPAVEVRGGAPSQLQKKNEPAKRPDVRRKRFPPPPSRHPPWPQSPFSWAWAARSSSSPRNSNSKAM